MVPVLRARMARQGERLVSAREHDFLMNG